LVSDGVRTGLSYNWFLDSGSTDRYIANDFANLYQQASGQHQWFNAPSGTAGNAISFTQAMTLNATGNLGIGTTNPTQKLHVSGNAIGGNVSVRIENTDASSAATFAELALITGLNTAGISAVSGAGGAGYLAFTNEGSERARIDSSGNLGLGVTPSAWGTGKAIEVGNVGNAFWGVGTADIRISANAYFSSGFQNIYGATGFATRYDQTAGVHKWYTAPSGTAGNAITFTQAMTLDASGNLLVGTTSPFGTSRLTVTGGGGFSAVDANGFTWTTANSTANTGNFNIRAVATKNACLGFTEAEVSDRWAIGIKGGDASLIFGSGNSDIATATERARITSGGDLLVGGTTAFGVGCTIKNSTSTPTFYAEGSATSGSTGFQMYSSGAAANRFYVDWAGTVFATSTTISAISDQRLKENVQDIDAGLDKIMALKPRKFDWKEGKGKNIKGDRGWIAQEFEQVFPDMVDEWKDEVPEGEEPYKSVRADLIPVLVKAIQEQQALIEQLKARLDAANI
jgi:hypothetical protein